MAEEPARFDLRPVTFRASGRRVAINALLLAAGVALLGSSLGWTFDVWLGAAGFAALAWYGVSWWFRIGSHGIRLDGQGVRRLDPSHELFLRWEELDSIDLAETPVQIRGRPLRLRYIVLESTDGRRILFSDLSAVGSPRIRIELGGPQPIVDVQESGILLALIADRAGDARYLPEVLMERPRAVPGEAEAADAPAGEPRRVSMGGLFAALAKIGSKFAKGIPAALKMFKPGLAVASGVLYGVLLSWQFAVAIMVMLAVHEYGHVHAMKRSGLNVRGIYFIPLLGAAAVTDDSWRSRRQQAYIALNGPLWGLGLTLAAAAFDALTGYRYPTAGVVVAWWALINLFNLLPVNPLDGGRVLAAVGYSLGSRLGLVLSVLMFAGALGLAFALEITLLAIVGLVGLIEFVAETSASVRFRQMSSSPRVAGLSAAGLATLKGLARPSLGEQADQAYFHLEARNMARLRMLARVTPMTRWQSAKWALAYVAVTAILVGLLLLASSTHPDAALAREIFR